MKATFLSYFVSVIIVILMLATAVGGFGLHLWTAVIAYQHAGLNWAMVCFFLPIASELYWFSRSWAAYGFIGSWYSIACISLASCSAAWQLLSLLAVGKFPNRTSENGFSICVECGEAFEQGVFCPFCGAHN
jgi:hypothetical protein